MCFDNNQQTTWRQIPLGWKLGMLVGAVFMVVQMIGIVQCQFELTRHFCYAPMNTMTTYTLSVTVDGKELGVGAIRNRYGIRYGLRDGRSWEGHSIHNVIELIELAETRYYSDNPAQIILAYQIDGGPKETWEFPLTD